MGKVQLGAVEIFVYGMVVGLVYALDDRYDFIDAAIMWVANAF